MKRNNKNRWLTILTTAVLLFMMWGAGFVYFYVSAAKVEAMNAQTDALIEASGIAVLTGGRGRLEAGIFLLENKKADKLLLSGVHPSVSIEDLVRLSSASADLFTCCIELDRVSTNTIDNARTSAQWAIHNGYQSLYLVTSQYHMRRSLLLFKAEMPDIIIIPFAVETHISFFATIMEYNKYLFTAVRLLV